jgi:phosphoenolpyruvate carboxykinase (GTP)
MGESVDAGKLPRIWYVDRFRCNADRKWQWPGYGENNDVDH